MSAGQGDRRFGWGMVAALVAVYLAQVARFDFLCDDAYISFRYAKNLVADHGLRFNCAESPPVEGYSNFLWVMLLAGAERLGIASGSAARVVSVACGVLLLVRLLRFLRLRLGLTTAAAGLVGLSYALFPPVGVWSTSGLAILPFALLFFLCFEAWIAEPGAPLGLRAGLFGLALTLLRTEGPLWLALIVGVAGLVGFQRDGRAFLRRAWPPLAFIALGFGAFLAWRVSYYGDWVSNTARAKGEMTAFTLERGLAHAGSFLLDHVGVVLLLATVPWLVLRERSVVLLTSLAVILASFSFAVLVGGDFMPFYRFFVLAAPFLAVLLALGVRSMWAAGSAGRAGAAVFALACTALSFSPQLDVSLFPERVREACRFRWNFFLVQEEKVPLGELGAWERSKTNCEKWVRLGRALDAVAAPGDTMVLGPIGAVGYHSQLHLYDQGGLVDRDVASRPTSKVRRSPGHDRAVPLRWFADREPTYAFARLTTRRAGIERVGERAFQLYLDRPEEGDLGRSYEVVLMDLPVERGFEPDEVLVLGRRIAPDGASPGTDPTPEGR